MTRGGDPCRLPLRRRRLLAAPWRRAAPARGSSSQRRRRRRRSAAAALAGLTAPAEMWQEVHAAAPHVGISWLLKCGRCQWGRKVATRGSRQAWAGILSLTLSGAAGIGVQRGEFTRGSSVWVSSCQGSGIGYAQGRMEWRSERPRHSSDRSLSAYRSLPTQPVQHREQGLWRAITLLSLFAGAVTATPQTWHHNQTLGAASYGNVGTASPASLEENSKEAPSLDAWGHWHGDNMTLQGVSSSELLRAERSPSDSSRGKKGSNKERHKKRNRHCRLHSLRLKVRDLGLGFESEELVLFSYCNGSCASARTNYDLTLQNLLQINVLTRDKHLSSNPCCRPVRYEVVSFMDVQNSWHTVDNLSAAECKCVG
ncbi:CMP-N-acetylneuraminate-beta-1,4-galactoside alpha-2,3-sialyltransferase isoform X4 [Sphaerodactylus townsendi]|uniref:CMP-N-acetylneuraminate-beta-1,4-galactoside alpha-2,3-sialyltransferase isoform X4 n=1 Tax=Sphaerodactylus townsendi TaxID=933632 RepID=UPI00202679A0|nr:CMP-N-acetylneuraminate-beta-1,4-galactoside alpha-2,3-sialyltransferase isoform X4 [Sphaerodactylus townsendi]